MDVTDGGINALYMLGIRQPTRFIYDFHFFHDTGSSYIQKLRAEFMEGLARGKPRFIVVFNTDWPPPLGRDRIKDFPELQEFLLAHYTIQRVNDEESGYTIYAAQ
jgi:hypothetical protein